MTVTAPASPLSGSVTFSPYYGGFNVSLTVTNNSSSPVSNWTATFVPVFAGTASGFTNNGNMGSVSWNGHTVTVTGNPTWQIIPAHGSMTFTNFTGGSDSYSAGSHIDADPPVSALFS